MEVFKGICASAGIGIGQAFVVPVAAARHIPQHVIEKDELEAEWDRLLSAVQEVRLGIQDKMKYADSKQSEILQTYIVMLEDAEFFKQIKEQLFDVAMNIEFVLNEKVTEMADMLRAVDDEYLAERAADVTDVFDQVIDKLLDYVPFDFTEIPENQIVVAESISSADAVVLLRKKVKGLVITEGGISSHLAILARNDSLPAVFGIQNLPQKIGPGQTVVVNGSEGTVIVCPDELLLNQFRMREKAELEEKQKLSKFQNAPAMTSDGVKFSLYANIGMPEDALRAVELGADGIGLFRTEFLFMGAIENAKRLGSSGVHSVTEEAQFQAYRQVLQTMQGKPVTIRTLDTGGDKLIKDAGVPIPEEQNPLLGVRAIRLSLAHKNLFKRQLRALFRASVYGKMRIMLPLVTHVTQIKETQKIIEEVKSELISEAIPFDKNIPLGIMVETAAAAIMADVFSKHSEFFSIGTNDLTQYTLGIDRENSAVAALYDEKNLAVLRLIKHTVESACKAGISVTVCGEMAGNPETVLLLAGLGVRNFSMAPVRISSVKAALASHTCEELKEMAETVLSAF